MDSSPCAENQPNPMEQHLSTELEVEEPWNDVSDILIAGTNQLTSDEILILPHMALIDITSAIQIMDPRMDVGFGRSNKKLTKHDDVSFDVNQTLLPSEVMMIIDISLACEVTWYSGRSLSQTILMSNYLRNLNQLKDHSDPLIKHVLRTYLLGLSNCCSIVCDEILKGHLRENEDVDIEDLKSGLNEEVDVSQTLYDLDQAYAVLNLWPNEIEGYRIPLMERLRFRIEYLYSLALLSCSPTTSTISPLETHLSSASEALRCMRLYSHSDKSICISDQSHRIKSAFDLDLIQNLPSHSPPRPVDLPKSLYDLILRTGKIIEDLLSVVQIGSGSTIPDWVTFFHGFSRQNPMPFPFVRSYLLSLFQDGNVIALNKHHTLDWLARECISNLSAGRVRLESRGDDIKYVLNRLSGLIVNYMSAFGSNRSRGRRILSNSLLEWKALYNATTLDRIDIPPATLQAIQTLIYYFSIESGLQLILMGFDLELYEHHHDRLSMWWVAQRLSERSCQLLKILSGGVESVDAKIVDILGKLAGAASEIARRKPEVNAEILPNRRIIFERRMKYLTSYQANFEDTKLIDELELGRDLLDYHSRVESESIDPDQLNSSLEKIHHQLEQLFRQAHLHKKIGLQQFQFFIHTLTKATRSLMKENNQKREEGVISIEKLEISNQCDEEKLNEAYDHQISNQKDSHSYSTLNQGLNYTEVSEKWFLIT